jgi:hypothetical protein
VVLALRAPLRKGAMLCGGMDVSIFTKKKRKV